MGAPEREGKYQILRAREAFDHNLRVYTQSLPDTQSYRQLQDIQRELTDKLESGHPVSRDKLHLTVAHLGKAADLFHRLQDHVPGLSQDTFTTALETFMTGTQHVLPRPYTLGVSGLAAFGSRHDVLALQLEPDEQFRRAFDAGIASVHSLLQECGVTGIEAYVRTDPNLYHLYSFTPHITLIRGIETDIPSVDSLPETVGFVATGIYDPRPLD